MNRTISSDVLSVTVKQLGAELCSIRRKSDDTEYMWQADAAIWPRHAPVLFPIVGKLANERYSHEGHAYGMKQHGFARDMDFELVAKDTASLHFRLQADEHTRKSYPFNFTLDIRYTLKKNRLAIRYDVGNSGDCVMPFSIGAHPGFTLRRSPADQLEDYRLEFEKNETVSTYLLGSGHLISDRVKLVLKNAKVLPITRNMFDRDALIFLDLKSDKISLVSSKRKDRLTVEFPGFPALGIWAKPGAPFVCIEPWFGYADTEHHDGMIMKKPGINLLEAGKSFSCTHCIEVD